MISKNAGLILLVGIALLLIAMEFFIEPIAQPQEYHDFAAQGHWLGVDNAWNVLSNITFALAGIWGMFLLLCRGKVVFIDHRERWLWIGVAVGLILTALGSGYYHLVPNDARLAWDRLPMTIVFMSYVAALVGERINMKLSLCLWPILLGVGVFSVLYWEATEINGAGDLRLYVGVQGFAILASLVMLLIRSPYTRNSDLAIVVTLYVLAKFFEVFDQQIYAFTGGVASGHPLKHFAAALAGVWLMWMILKRKAISPLTKKGDPS